MGALSSHEIHRMTCRKVQIGANDECFERLEISIWTPNLSDFLWIFAPMDFLRDKGWGFWTEIGILAKLAEFCSFRCGGACDVLCGNFRNSHESFSIRFVLRLLAGGNLEANTPMILFF